MDYKEAYEDMVKVASALKEFKQPEARQEYILLQILNSINFLRADVEELRKTKTKFF